MKIDLTLPELPYDRGALQPILTEETFDYHYGKHHLTYVKNLNALVVDTPMAQDPVEDIIKHAHRSGNISLFNNAAQHWNHSFFWRCLSPNAGGVPTGAIANRIALDFGGFENFKALFSDTAIKLFGSGWAWLALSKAGTLEIVPMRDACTPLVDNRKPLLTLDVWEHAYYIDYQNARPKFVEGFWEIVNWDFVNENLLG